MSDKKANTFWDEPTLEELAKAQGVRPIRRLEDVLGKGAALWEDDADFESFLAAVHGVSPAEA